MVNTKRFKKSVFNLQTDQNSSIKIFENCNNISQNFFAKFLLPKLYEIDLLLFFFNNFKILKKLCAESNIHILKQFHNFVFP